MTTTAADKMAKRLKLATSIPEFQNNEEAAEFFETHDISLVWDQLKPFRPSSFLLRR